MNLSNNVTKSAFKYDKIKTLFSKAYSIVREGCKCGGNSSSNNFNATLSLSSSFKNLEVSSRNSFINDKKLEENNDSINKLTKASSMKKESVKESEDFVIKSCILRKILDLKLSS